MRALLFLAFGFVCATALGAPASPTHPRLLLTAAGVAELRANLGHYPLFDAALAEAKATMDHALREPMDVPVPRDAAGYTHERHKRNYVEMQLAGFLYQVTGDARYATFVRDLLDRYADLYPTLGLHPAAKSSAPGKLFHQMLNETVWLVNVSEAYDCIYDTLRPEERARIENNVLRPMARYFTVDRAAEFDRVHNHGTWACTAVGMAGYVMGDDHLVQMALHGTKLDDRGGYLRQLDELFSPDGYYCEGPYYARYAMMPFYLFAQVIDNNQPELKIFARRDGLLRKAVYALLEQTAPSGAFLPFNDALKEKDIRSPDVVFAVDAAYRHYGQDPHLLSIAQRQHSVALGVSGLEVARALAQNPQPPAFAFHSVAYRDGPAGDAGGIAILRAAPGELALFKYTSFGMEHGHYDKLAYMFYDQGREIVPDYGSARYLNVEAKDGGRYLHENTTFAKQTIAHNTVTIDERSDYAGKYDTAESQHSQAQFFHADDPNFQVASAVDDTAYPGVRMQRTLAMVRDPALHYPVLVDVFRLIASQPHQYDYTNYYAGTFLETNVPLQHHVTSRPVFGQRDGYEHLWVAADGAAGSAPVRFTWMNGDRYYTLTSAPGAGLHAYFVQVGANDPHFDLRNENALVLRADAKGPQVFASVLEPHGLWDGVKERTSGEEPTIRDVRVLASTDEGTVVRISGRELAWTLLIANAQPARPGHHRVVAGGETFEWDGDAVLRK